MIYDGQMIRIIEDNTVCDVNVSYIWWYGIFDSASGKELRKVSEDIPQGGDPQL